MHRYVSRTFLALLAVGLVQTAPAFAEERNLEEEVRQLRERIDALSSQASTLLEQEVDKYLDDQNAWAGAQGGDPLQGITIHARFTTVLQGTLGLDPDNRTVVNGDVDLDFDFQVTDNLNLFIHLTANEGEGDSSGFDNNSVNNGGFPSQFGTVATGFPPMPFGAIAGPTLSGRSDGIGVNGTVPTDPGSITVYEAAIQHTVAIGQKRLHWEIGTIDPRRRFLQNDISDDENTQFLNNLFDDSPAVPWLTDASGRTVIGIHMWMHFGDNNQFTVNWGWFNTPGQFFNDGQFMIQVAWQGEVNGREMNIRVTAFINEFFQDSTGDGDAGAGVSWDWLVTDQIGVFFRLAANGDDVNPVELDASVGVVFTGLIASRPDDTIGVAIGFISANDQVIVVSEDTEFTLEIYYRFMLEDSKLQITPHMMFVSDPGGGESPWADDQLFILGVRIHVPF